MHSRRPAHFSSNVFIFHISYHTNGKPFVLYLQCSISMINGILNGTCFRCHGQGGAFLLSRFRNLIHLSQCSPILQTVLNANLFRIHCFFIISYYHHLFIARLLHLVLEGDIWGDLKDNCKHMRYFRKAQNASYTCCFLTTVSHLLCDVATDSEISTKI